MSLIQLFIDNATPIMAFVGLVLSLYQYFRNFRAQQRAQAELISAWWVRVDADEKLVVDKNDFVSPIKNPPTYHTGILIRNSSGAPVYSMKIVAPGFVMSDGRRTAGTRVFTLKQEMLPPGEFVCFQVNKDEWSFPELASSICGKVRPIANNKEWMVESVSFTDAAGRKWCRTAVKGLRRSWFWREG